MVEVSMDKLFYKYIILHKRGGIPGIGTFSLERQPAQLEFTTKSFTAPQYKIKFLQENAVADKHLYSFLAEESKIDSLEAIKLFSEFSYNLKEEVHAHKKVVLQGFGELTENAFGEYELVNSIGTEKYFPAIAAERIARDEVESPQTTEPLLEAQPEERAEIVANTTVTGRKKDDWWIYALIIAILAIAAIVYYYMQYGTLR